MTQNIRQQRIAQDLQAVAKMVQHSTILTVHTTSETPDRLTIKLRGNGVVKMTGSHAQPELRYEHEIELRLPLHYPQSPPDIRWLTPLFHPNVSYSGFANLADVGLTWNESMGLDLVCERLWDMTRLADYNLDRAVNYAAKKWISEELNFHLPVDARPLCDRAASANRNVVKYRRKGESSPASYSGEILFIDDNTSPALPPASANSPSNAESSEGILYIE